MSGPNLLPALSAAFASPTLKQKEAYGRFAHTLAAASLIGEVTIIFSEGVIDSTWLWRIAGLTFSGVICFVGGAILSKGE